MARKSTKSLQTASEVYSLVKKYYQGTHQAKEIGQPVVWYCGCFPVELLVAAGTYPFFIEHYPVVLSAKQKAQQYFEAAEQRGYSQDLCSYATLPIAFAMEIDNPEFDHPLGGPAKPDFLVASHFFCDQRHRYIKTIGDLLDKPVCIIDAPHNLHFASPEDIDPQYLQYYVAELERLLSFLEAQTGRRVTRDQLSEACEETNRAIDYFLEGLDYNSYRPAPMTVADYFAVMFPLMCRTSQKETTEFCRRFRDEMKERAEQGIAAIPNEKYRVVWDNIPLWYNLGLFDYLAEKDVAVVGPTLYWDRFVKLDPGEPLESIARRDIVYQVNSHFAARVNWLRNACQKFHADGVIMPGFDSCKPIYLFQEGMKRQLSEELDIPILLFETDFLDDRYYADEVVKNRLDAFVEAMHR